MFFNGCVKDYEILCDEVIVGFRLLVDFVKLVLDVI